MQKLNRIATHPLQSWEWEEFRKAWGNEVLRIDGYLLTIHKLPLLSYKLAIFEKGPMPTFQMIEKLKNFGTKENLIFIKLEPNYVVKKDNISCADEKRVVQLLKENGAIPGKTIFAPTTFWIDLTKPEEELMASFHPKTRYNIRLAQRNGVEVKEDNSDKAFEIYLRLMRETVTRDKFYAHNEKYHRLMWKYLHGSIAHLLTASYQNQVVAAWILFAHNGVLYYPYGASTHKYKNVMANNLIMWEAICLGKHLGLKTFDLWGREPGKGFTKFKEGYNPQIVEFIGTWDLVINPFLYWPYRVMDKIRWIILRIKGTFVRPGF